MDDVGSTAIFKQDALGRVTRSREQRDALLDEFERSGLKGAQFARAVGVNYQTFASWVQQRRHARGEYAAARSHKPLPPDTGLRLVEATMRLHGANPPSGSQAGLLIHLPGEASALISTPQQARLMAELLHTLRAPC